MRLLLLLTFLIGCPSTAPSNDDDATDPPGDPVDWPQTLGIPVDRLASIEGPEGWDQSESLPLVVLLHGYQGGMTGEIQELLFKFRRQIESQRFLYVLPTGTENSGGDVFWNATPACCDYENQGIDDSGYLRGLVEEAIERFNVDEDRVYFSGHSNGHFMSYRMACDHPDLVAGVAGLAGAAFNTTDECAADEGVAYLHIHGDADTIIPYEGSPDEYPSAPAAASRWADRGGCGSIETDVGRLDLLDASNLAAMETRRDVYSDCADANVELWTIEGGTHIPLVNETFGEEIIRWLLQQER